MSDSFLACVFIEGANKPRCESFRKKLADDRACDDSSPYPGTVEEALSAMVTHEDNHEIKKGVDFGQFDANRLKCHHCGKHGHIMKKCPDLRKKNGDDSDADDGDCNNIWGVKER